MKAIALIAMVLTVAFAVYGQPGKPDYDFSTIDFKAGFLDADWTSGKLNELGDGADVLLNPSDPQGKPLRIRARSIKFSYAEGEDTPERIVIEGDVFFDHPLAQITAGRAEWLFKKNQILLEDNPVAKRPTGGELGGDRIAIDLDKGTMRVSTAQAKGFPFAAGPPPGGGQTHPALLKADDVRDWRGLLSQIKQEAKADAPSPGKRIMTLLPPDARAFLASLATEQEPADDLKGDILKQFNALLMRRDFYAKESWANVKMEPGPAGIFDKDPTKIPEDELVRFNRLAFQTAYSQMLRAPTGTPNQNEVKP